MIRRRHPPHLIRIGVRRKSRDLPLPGDRSEGMGRASRAVTAGLCAAAFALAGCAEPIGVGETAADGADSLVNHERINAELPPDWSEVEMPKAQGYPAPLMTLTSAPLRPIDRPPPVCGTPDAVLDRLPVDGAAIQISEWQPQRMPARPERIALDRSTFGAYECSGRSHVVNFHENGRGVHVVVWLTPGRVDPEVKRQAVRLLNGLKVHAFPSGECDRDFAVGGTSGFRGADGLSCGEAALLWTEWMVPAAELTACERTGHVHEVRVTDGITCGVAERFIVGGTNGFAPHPGGWIERSGRFTCRIREFSTEPGLHVDCVDTDRGASGPRFTFIVA